MKHLFIFFHFLFFLPQFSCSGFQRTEKEIDPSLDLWYDKPAERWTEALPIGNGCLGAMVYAKTSLEKIQFNEETLWAGQPHDYAHKGVYKYLNDLRKLLWAGKQNAAHDLANFGVTSGITEMFLQSHLRDDAGDLYPDILPALPGGLSSGKIPGIKGHGGFQFFIVSENGALVAVDVKSIIGNRLNLRNAG